MAIILVLTALTASMLQNTAQPDAAKQDTPLNAHITKWFNNHTAAASITYDGQPLNTPYVFTYVREHNVTIDYAMVTGNSYGGVPVYSNPDNAHLIYLLTELIPEGFGYFGHGHNHVDHDLLSYEEALESFQTCFDAMAGMGLKPVAYAYPRNAGHERETQQALENSGFLNGRLITTNQDHFYNMRGYSKQPHSWFGLQSIGMQSIHYETNGVPCKSCINDNDELTPVLDQALEHTAWIILTYHSIGNPMGYGWYDFAEFQKDVQSIKNRDFWVASMNDITLYSRERANASIEVSRCCPPGIERIEITVSDGLDNETFDHPLTVSFDLPQDWVDTPFAVYQDDTHLGEFAFDTENAMLSLKPNEQTYVLLLHPTDQMPAPEIPQPRGTSGFLQQLMPDYRKWPPVDAE